MSDSRMSDRSLASAAALPKKQEWGLLYGHRALQLQQAKSMQKLLSEQKKQEFKRQLDAQISSKNSQGQAEKEADRRYYEMVTRQAQETKEKEQRDKFQKYLQRKQIEEQNQRSLLTALDPKREDFGKVYNIPIGLKSEQEKRERAETLRRDVVQTLDQQREQKEAMRRLSRLEESELDCRNAAIQQEQFSNRSLNSKKYEQNQAVFDYYRQLHQQKQRRNREMDEQLQEREQERKAQEDSRKREEEAAAKHKRTIEMRDTLEQQVEIHNHRKQEEGRPNPEQATYAFISNIFRERKAPFDKKEYSLFLEKQAEQQRLSRRQQQFMSEEEYRLNANQLHRATSGHYPADHYHDRSMGTLGDKLALPAVQPLPSDDNELVKNKLDTLRSKRNRSMLHNPAEHADFV